MNILMVLWDDYPPHARVRKQAKSLVNAGHDVRVLCEADTTDTENVNGIEVRRVSRPDPSFSPTDIRRSTEIIVKNVYPFWEGKIQKELDDNIDAVHVHDLPLAKTVLRVSDVPVVLDLHENYREAVYQYRSKLSFWETVTDPKMIARRMCKPARRYHREQQFAMEQADHVLAVVPEAKEAYVESGIDPNTVSVVSNTVDPNWFDKHVPDELGGASDDFILTYVGTLSGPHRGLDTVIRAVPEIKTEIPNVRFRIAGGGHQAPLERLAEDLGIEDSVEFTGWIDETEFPKYMKEADVGLVPHRSNSHTNTTIPHKLFQYMAAELPVIATDTSAVSRVVKETNAGLVVPSEDPAVIAEATIKIAKSDKGVTYGNNGRAAVESTYNWKRDGQRLREVYDGLNDN